MQGRERVAVDWLGVDNVAPLTACAISSKLSTARSPND
jgi:hypothetical protein